MRWRNRQASGGFAWVELIVGIVVVCILMVAFSPLAVRYVKDLRLERAKGDLQLLAKAYEAYFRDTGHWPCSWNRRWSGQRELSTQECFERNQANLAGWSGPYLNDGARIGPSARVAERRKGLIDPWGRAYIAFYYGKNPRYPGGGGGFVGLLSRGPDGRQHTSLGHALRSQRRGDDILQVITNQIDASPG